jgi:hypothetical protein
MGNFRFKRLEKYRVGGTGDQMELKMTLPTTPSGKIYRYSPNSDAVPRLFLIGNAPPNRQVLETNKNRTQLVPGSSQTVCPYSGIIAPDEEFFYPGDQEHAFTTIGAAVESDVAEYIGGLLDDMAKNINRSTKRSGGFGITMKTTRKHHPKPSPIAIRQDLLRNLQCDTCQREYGVYAIALYCPDCGAPNISLHFQREAELVSTQIVLADQKNAENEEEIAYRLMGNAHEDVLTAFEAMLKTLYRQLVRMAIPQDYDLYCKKIFNEFQNIDKARKKYAAIEIDPFSCLNTDELKILRLHIQKRHVIGHNLGIVDENYVALDEDEQPGQTVTIIGKEIRQFSAICSKVVAAMEDYLIPAKNGLP